jgi:hypothetical protein
MALNTQLKKVTGPRGVAVVKILNSKIRITYRESGDVYELDKNTGGWPKGKPEGEYTVNLTKEGDKILGLAPTPSATYVVTFNRFTNRTEEIPAPRIQRGGQRTRKSDGQAYFQPDKLVFGALVTVQQDGHRFDGLDILLNLPYCFEQYPGTNEVLLSTTSKRDLEQIESFLRSAGLDFANVSIPFSSNVLPWLESYLQTNGRMFMVTLNGDGWVDSMAELPAHLAPKKKSKK